MNHEGETIYNAMRLAHVAVKKGDEVRVFMLGKGGLFEKSGNEEFNVMQDLIRVKSADFISWHPL